MTTREIAIVGGGPKAAALAAKAEVLNRTRRRDLRITIFEQTGIGANWDGQEGYTDGEARLCTPAERDLGFPYDAGVLDREVAARMYADYSWGAYLIATGGSRGRQGINDWVNRGRRPPTHLEFSKYLQWAVAKSGATVELAKVNRLEADSAGWKIHRRTAAVGNKSQGIFDGVVLTGPGPSLRRLARNGSSNRIVEGREFWKDAPRFLASAGSVDEAVIIVGAGGTSAAIAARVLREPSVREVVIIGDRAALFSRTETFFENQIFSDEDIWKRLDTDTRRDFTDRLNRGVVWATISDELSKSRKVRFEPGRGEKVTVRTGVAGEEIVVTYTRGTTSVDVYASLVIDASGFDSWWFAPMLPANLQKKLAAKTPKAQRLKRQKLADAMTDNLALFDEAPGPLHVPMLSQAVGPGFASLMALGAMSDLILGRY